MSVVPWQCGDDAEVKTWHLTPTMSPAPIGRGYKRLVHNAHHLQAQSPWGCDSDQSSLCAQRVAKDPSFLHADIEDSDQTGRMTRLILVFDGRTSLVLSCTGGGGSPTISRYQCVNKREASTTTIPGIHPGRLRYQSILHS